MTTTHIPDESQHSGSGIEADSAYYARLVFRSRNGQTTRKNLLRPTTLIGSSARCSIRLVSPNVSRVHCAILLDDGLLRVRDLRSRSGILLNGQPINAGILSDGDQLQVGRFLFGVEMNLSAQPAQQSSTADTSHEIDVTAISKSRHEQDLQQEKLQNREARLEERETELIRKEAAKQKEFDARQRELDDLTVSLERRRQRLDEESVALDGRSADLDERHAAIDSRREAIDELSAELDARTVADDSRQAELDVRAENIERESHEMEKRRADLTERRAELEQRDQQITQEQKALAELHTTLQQKSRVLEEQNCRLAKGQVTLSQQQDDLKVQTDRLAAEQKQFCEARDALTREAERLTNEQNMLEQEQGRIVERIQSLDEQEQSLTNHRRSLEIDGEKLDQRQHVMETAERDLAERNTEFVRRSDAIDQRATEIEAFQAGLEAQSADQQKLQDALETDLKNLKNAQTRLRQASVDHEKQVKQFQADRKLQEQQQCELDVERGQLREAATRLAEQNDASTQLRVELEEQQRALEERRHQLDEERRKRIQGRDRHLGRIERLRAKRRKLDERERQVAEQAAVVKLKIESIESETRAIDERKERLLKDAAKQQRRKVALAKRAAVLTDAEIALSAGHSQYSEQLSALKNDLNCFREDIETASRKIIDDQQRLDAAFDSWAVTPFAQKAANGVPERRSSGSLDVGEEIDFDENVLLERAVHIGLVEGEHVERLQSAAGPEKPPGSLIERLVADGDLTRFQINQLKTGKTGHLIVGEYLLLEPVGRGQWSEVWKVRSRKSGEIFALRRIQKRWHYRAQVTTALLRTWQMTASLDSPYIVRSHQILKVDNRPIALFEFVDGPLLGHLLNRTGPLAPSIAIRIAGMIARGLVTINRKGYVHRRLTPAGILIARDGKAMISGVGYPNIAVGSSTAREQLSKENEKEQTESERYLAPELAANGRADIRSDLFSLGCIVIEMLVGRRSDLFQFTPQEGGCGELGRFAQQLIAENPDDRPEDAVAVVRALDQIEAGIGQLPERQATWEKFLGLLI